jgi:phosphopantothenate---cysteine ligase (CTP)
MHCIVTAGPTYEPLDDVRRLINFSTGKLGAELANYLVERGHQVTLLQGQHAIHGQELKAQSVSRFGTTSELVERLRDLRSKKTDAVFHVAAVSDFGFGKVWRREPSGELVELHAKKISTRHGSLLAELIPTRKIIAELREWFPEAWIVGWKYDIDGDQSRIVELAREQINENRTDACVVNGPAYGAGFGLILNNSMLRHLSGTLELFGALDQAVAGRSAT